MLCMVLVICNSVSILADTPAAATTTAENQVSETKTAKNEKSSEENKSTDDNDTSKQSEETDETKDEAPEATTTENKEETTEATTEEKEDAATATTEAEEPTTEATTEDKATTEAADETSESDNKKEATTTENSSETSGTTEETTEAKEETAASELTYTNDDVVITVSEVAEGAIPEGAELKVVPILKDDANTQEQYAEVEEQIKNKGLETETQIKGFLAYDITLINKDNNEIEPSGEVQVSISYKDSVLPDSLSEERVRDMDVTVMHLEENDMGQVEKVVDMSENSQIKNMQTTESNAIEKAEFVTESFSVFTISWVDGPSLKAYCVDSNGNEIPVNDEDSEIIIRNISINREVKVSELSTKLDGYTFEDAYVTSQNIESSKDFDEDDIIQQIRYNEGKWQYNKSQSDNNWSNISNSKLYFQYRSSEEKISKKPTVNSSELGIDINLYNYNNAINSGTDTAEAGFYFSSGKELDGGLSLEHDNEYTNSNSTGLRTGLVKRNLQDSYPLLKNGKTSLKKLFTGTEKGTTSKHENLDGLFYEDEDGYYTYNSKEYHAQLNTETNRIDVYNAKLSPDTKHSNPNVSGPNFLPFNQFPQDATTEGQLYSVSGGREKTDLWFGMNINTSFYQPKDGKVNGEKMVFEFSGDDDVWVFIDDVLVLDIGGIHGAIDGSINFQSGEVKVGGNGTTLAEQFIKAYMEKGLTNSEITSRLDSMFNKVDGKYTSFKNFSSHDMKFFYLERGGGASNCKIKFNMPVLPEDSIRIGKEISNYDKGAYNDVQFQFKLYTGTGTDKNLFKLVSENTKYTLIKANGEQSTEHVGKNGIFTLKHGEQAQFDKLRLDTNYYVKEIGLSSETYDKVTIESVGIVNENDEDITENETEIESKILNVGENHIVNFQNQCAATNMKYLIIKKTLEGSSDGNQDESFTFKVTVGGGVYKGNYKIGDSYNSTDDGTITLKAGEVAVILGNATLGTETGIPSGTSFKVEEIKLNEDIYRIPSYTMKEKNELDESLVSDPVISDDTYNGYAAGDITLNGNAEVNVTNAYNTEEDNQPYITVSKTFKGLSWKQIQSLKDGFSLTVKDSSSEEVDTLTLDGHGSTIAPYNISPSDGENNEDEVRVYTFTWKVTECSTGKYTVEENGETLNGYDVSTSGEETVDVSESTWSFSSDVNVRRANDSLNITLGTQSIVAASLTEKEYLIWTSMSLSSAQKAEVIRWLNSDEDNDLKNFRTGANSVTLDNSHFYSGDGLKDGITLSGSTIKFVPSVDGSQTGTLTFGDKSAWQHVLSGDYTWKEQKNGDIDVTNTYSKQYTIKVDKTWVYPEGFNPYSTTTEHSEVMVALYDRNTIAEDASGRELVKTTEGGTCTFTNLSKNTYTVREVVKSGDQYIPIESGGYVKLGEDDKVNNVTGNIYSVSYGEKTTGLPEGVDKYYTVTNTLVLGSVEITKTDSENNPLAGAEFTITGPNNYSKVLTTELKDAEDEKIATVKFTNLLPGEYTITETKSPAGHSLLANPIKIKIGAGQDDLITNGILNQDKGYEAVASSTGDKSTYYYNWGATVVNNKLFTMPEAGGRNIFMMTLAGTAMIALAARSTIYYRRRRGAHNKTRR